MDATVWRCGWCSFSAAPHLQVQALTGGINVVLVITCAFMFVSFCSLCALHVVQVHICVLLCMCTVFVCYLHISNFHYEDTMFLGVLHLTFYVDNIVMELWSYELDKIIPVKCNCQYNIIQCNII